MKRKIKRISIYTLTLLLALSAGGWVYIASSLPTIDGEMELSGLEAEVRVLRDEYGVPHIFANSEHDLYFSVGFVHAQDRLWQMEMNRRVAQGRLAEVVGVGALETDRFLRTIGVYERAKSAFKALDEPTRQMLISYADGVNAYLTNHSGALAPEFLILGHRPEPWRPEDSLAWLKMMAWDLSKNWRKEIGRLTLLSRLTPRQVMQFYPPYRGDEPLPLPDLETLYADIKFPRTAGTKIAFIGEADSSLGSNNWVVDGTKTVSGKPLLANDPHLGLKSPSVWYLAHLSLNGKNLVGVTLPGLPFIVLGRNDKSAWGFTNTGPDTQDLYIEKISADGKGYATPEGHSPFRTRREVIRVKGAEDIVLNIRETRHGPVISDVMDSLRNILPEGHVVAFRWTALDDRDSTIEAARKWMGSETWAQFVDNLSSYHGPQQNIIYADVSGDIGYYAPADVPQRKAANTAMGQLPVPGWKAEFDWGPYIPKDQLPRLKNPEKGYIVTANAKVVADDYPHYLTHEWAFPYRTMRINRLLEAREKHSIESFMEIQADSFSEMADEFLPLLLPHIEEFEPELAAALGAWDRRMDRDRPEPLIYMAWHRALAQNIYADELGDLFPAFFALRPEFLYRVLNNTDGSGKWCDNVISPKVEDCAAVVREALVEALAELMDELGPNWRDWRWGDVHRARHVHRPFTFVGFLRPFFDIVTRVDGGPYTVNANNVRPGQPEPFETRNGPSFRAIYDLSDLDNSRFIIPTGQSGNPLSGFYNQLTGMWAGGRYIRIPTDRALLEREAVASLLLKPAKERQ